MSYDRTNHKVGRVGILGGSYPPQVDGVANTMWNYSRYLEKNYEGALVLAPKVKHLGTVEGPSPLYRFASLDTVSWMGYSTGLPMDPGIVRTLQKTPITLLHTHDAFNAAFIYRELKYLYDMPMILTYHTAFDQDIRALLKCKPLADLCIAAIAENAAAADEVWVVSRGAEINLRSIGYEGETVLMPNGVEMPHEKASAENMAKYCVGLPPHLPVFLFVGRITRRKGIFQIIAALDILKEKGLDFRMVFIGEGLDLALLKREAEKARVEDKCLFPGKILDRQVLQAWYSRSDLFLFPSEYDTHGLVVDEAAAVGTPSLLIRGSAPAENIQDDVNGFLTENTPAAIAARILQILENPAHLKDVGEKASEDLYISWEDAVGKAYARYQIVLDRHRRGCYKTRKKLPGERILKAQAEYMALMARLFP